MENESRKGQTIGAHLWTIENERQWEMTDKGKGQTMEKAMVNGIQWGVTYNGEWHTMGNDVQWALIVDNAR